MRKRILVSVLSCITMGLAVVAGGLLGASDETKLTLAAEALTVSSPIAEKYVLGETVTLPESATLEYNGESYNASVTLRDPEGRGYNVSSKTLTISGQYTIEYKALTEEGHLICEKQTFDCYDTLYSSSGNTSKMHYGTFDEYPEAAEGLAVELAAGEILTFNKMVDVSDLAYDGGSFKEIISLYVAPNILYGEDATQLTFTFTDAYDSDNQLKIVLKKYTTTVLANQKTYAIHSYVTAAASGQSQVGLEKTGKGDFYYGDGSTYKVHKNNFYGTAITFSMTGGYEDVGSYVGKDELSLGMNYAKGQIFTQTKRADATVRSLVSDWDDNRLYDEPWAGFTTGEAYLSISATNYKATTCRFVVTDLLGVDKETIVENSFKDDNAPVISVEMEDYEQAPAAIVGVAYPVFAAKASDNYDGDVDVSVSVWKNYKGSNATRISLIDGKFVPEQEDTYSIVYKAVDKMGNVSEKEVEVSAVTNLERVSLNLGEKIEEGETGKMASVAAAMVEGGSGNHHLSIYAIHKENADIRYEVDADTLSFLPLYGGVYQIVYTYGDYIETKTESYEITIRNSVAPYIEENISLPKYVIKNGVYKLPTVSGYVFGGNTTKEKNCTLLVRQDNGSLMAVSSNEVKVTAEKIFTVVYQLNDGAGVSKRQFNIPVIDTGFGVADSLNLSKYFISDTFNATPENNAVLYTVAGSNGDTAKMEFIKTLLAENFYLGLSTDREYSQFDSINVTLTDSVDKDISVCISILKGTGNAVMTVSGDTNEYDLGQKFFANPNAEFNIKYDGKTNTIELPSGSKVKIAKDKNGQTFGGFKSGFVNLAIELGGIDNARNDNAGIRISKVNNQSFSAMKNDIIEPEISTRTMRGEMLQGDEVEILPLYASDVVDPYVNFKMKVTDSDGEVVTATDGILLDGCDTGRSYKIVLEKFGQYSVNYEVTDSAGWTTFYSYALNVGETEPPTITLSGVVTSGTVGDTIKVATATVADNADSGLTYVCYLKTPSSVFYKLVEGENVYEGFVAKEKGTYNVYYYAIDSVGNYTIVSYAIVVS